MRINPLNHRICLSPTSSFSILALQTAPRDREMKDQQWSSCQTVAHLVRTEITIHELFHIGDDSYNTLANCT